MSEILTTELKSDLENIYKITGDLLTMLQSKSYSNMDSEMRDTMEIIKFRLQDITGTLQKDIFNCDYLVSKYVFEKNIKVNN